MARLYPPYLEGTLPAFWLNKEGNGLITIPFAFNKAVSSADIASFAVRVKTVQNDILLAEVNIDSAVTSSNLEELDFTTSAGYWDMEETRGGGNIYLAVGKGCIAGTEAKLIIGQFYKIQVAFKDADGIVGYYSTVGVVKCTSKPSVYIAGFSETKANNNNTEFVGVFEQPMEEGNEYSGDITEKVYSCNFKIYYEGEVVYESGEMAHSIENNVTTYRSEDHWHFFRDLEDRKIYTIIYTVTTNNNLVVSSPEYLLVEQRSIPNGYEFLKVHADLIKEEGYMKIYLTNEGGSGIAGMFVLSRADTQDPYYWMELTRFGMHGEKPDADDVIFRDFTVEQGKTYIYRIRRYNEHNVYSEAIESDRVYADFDHIFIYDGERQLKVAFNPQVSNFKTQLAESRSETIGGKYPFFFRNARVGYKTFPISGLISMQMDDNELFTTYDSILRIDYRSPRYYTKHSGDGISEAKKHSDLIDENFASERLFKLKVLDWLNDGKVKLFRSPGEGNYLIRLMDVSLTPNTTVGRMLHTFNATAYECAPVDYNSFVAYKIIVPVPKEDIDDFVNLWRKVDYPTGTSGIAHQYYSGSGDYSINLFSSNLEHGYTNNIEFKDWLPGSQFKLITSAGGEATSSAGIFITIGQVGSYYVDDIQNVYGIYYCYDNPMNPYDNNNLVNGGTITYQYQDRLKDDFNLISDIEVDIGSSMQVVGKGLNYEVVKDYLEVVDYQDDNSVHLSEGVDLMPLEQVSKLFDIQIFKRPVEYVYYTGSGQFSASKNNLFKKSSMGMQGSREFKTTWDKIYWNLYATLENEAGYELFSDKTIMAHSPFGLFVVKNLSEDDVLAHRQANDPTKYHGEDPDHKDYFNEGPLIDKWLMKQTAEQELFEALYDETKPTIYVIDAWMNKVYNTGNEEDKTLLQEMFKVIYNDNPSYDINLQEIGQISLEDLTTKTSGGETADEGQSIFKLGIGLYANVLYSKIITDFAAEAIDQSIRILRDKWKNATDLVSERTAYADYAQALYTAIKNLLSEDKNNYYMKDLKNNPSAETVWDTQW